MKYLHFFLSLGLVLTFQVGQAQTITKDRPSVALQVGDEFAVSTAFPVLQSVTDSIILTGRNRVIVLDFFDTFCTSCIESLPKLKKLQDSLKNEVLIVMVTWQDRATIEKFLATNPFVQDKDVKLPFIYGDEVLKQAFPHRGIPHMVWLFRDRVQAVTFSDFLDKKNLLTLYQDGKIDLPLKDDFGARTLRTQSDTAIGMKTSILLTGYKDGIPSKSFQIETDSLNGMSKSSVYNQSVLTAYVSMWNKIRRAAFLLLPERIVWDVPDSSQYQDPTDGSKRQVWLSENAICYERLDADDVSDTVRAERAIQDLNTLLGLDVYWSTALRPVLVIRNQKGSQARKLRAEQNAAHPSPEGQLGGSETLAFFGLDLSGLYPPAIDEANYPGILEVDNFNTVQELNRQLNRYGLEVIETRREIDVLVFKNRGL